MQIEPLAAIESHHF